MERACVVNIRLPFKLRLVLISGSHWIADLQLLPLGYKESLLEWTRSKSREFRERHDRRDQVQRNGSSERGRVMLMYRRGPESKDLCPADEIKVTYISWLHIHKGTIWEWICHVNRREKWYNVSGGFTSLPNLKKTVEVVYCPICPPTSVSPWCYPVGCHTDQSLGYRFPLRVDAVVENTNWIHLNQVHFFPF